MTQRYMHLSLAALDAAIRLLEQSNGPAQRGGSLQDFGDVVETGRFSEGTRPNWSAYALRATVDNLRGINEFAGLPTVARSPGRRAKVGGEAGIRTHLR
jgi:hypothetical protein